MMYEYEILRIKRYEEVTREFVTKRGKTKTKTVDFKVDKPEDFDSRVKNTLAEWNSKGWQVVSANYHVPVSGFVMLTFGFTESDSNKTEFIALLQREKV